MKNKGVFFRIETIFLFIAVINLAYTIYFKTQAISKYIELDSFLSKIEVDYLQNNFSDSASYAESIKKEFSAYTYFDSTLQEQIQQITEQVKEKTFTMSEFLSLISSFEYNLNITEKRLNFGYDSMIYCSLILITVTLIVLFINNTRQKKEIETLLIRQEEQKHISRELHDGVAQSLASLKIYLEKADLEKSYHFAQEALNEIRYMIGILHFDLSDGFENIVQHTTIMFEKNHGIKTEMYSALSSPNTINPKVQLEMLRILQEALSNVVRHSKAHKVEVKIIDCGKMLNMTITDDGIGFDENILSINKKTNIDSDKIGHFGLKNIRDRAQSLGGRCEIKSQNGTVILVSVPIK